MRALQSSAASSIALCVLVSGACGGPAQVTVSPTSPFSEADALLFDDGVDLMSDPSALGGRWSADWEREFKARVERSDAVLIGEVTTLRTDVDPEQQTTYRLVVRVEEVVRGKVPADEILLSASEGASGYSSVARSMKRIMNKRFVVLLKWYRSTDTKVDAHWHLMPASEPVTRRLTALTTEEVPAMRTVIVHEN